MWIHFLYCFPFSLSLCCSFNSSKKPQEKKWLEKICLEDFQPTFTFSQPTKATHSTPLRSPLHTECGCDKPFLSRAITRAEGIPKRPCHLRRWNTKTLTCWRIRWAWISAFHLKFLPRQWENEEYVVSAGITVKLWADFPVVIVTEKKEKLTSFRLT